MFPKKFILLKTKAVTKYGEIRVLNSTVYIETHQIKEIKDHAYQTAKAYDVNDISQNLVDIFNGI